MLNSFNAEMGKLVRRPATYILIGLWVAMSVMFTYVIPYVTYANSVSNISVTEQKELLLTLLPEQMIPAVISGFPMFGSAIALVMGALVVGSEFGWGTLKTIFIQGPSRLKVLLGKLSALAIMVLTLVVAVYISGALISYVIANVENVAIKWASVWTFLQAIGAGWLILSVFASIGVVLAALFRGTSVPIGLGLVYVLAIEGLIGFAGMSSDFVANMAKLLPRSNSGSLAASFIPTWLETNTPGVMAAVGPMVATISLVVYVILFTFLGVSLFLKRDVH
jgi:ABC-2 type transport system permease protein